MTEGTLKNYLGQNCLFLLFWPLEVKPLTWGQIWRHSSGRAVNGLSFAFFRAALALWVHELECLQWRIVEMVENREHFTFYYLWWPDLWPDLKNERNTFLMLLDELSNAACRMSLRSSGAELEGGA